MLTREQALVLAREVTDGKTRSYVSASHALSEYILGEEEAAIAQHAADVATVAALEHARPALIDAVRKDIGSICGDGGCDDY